MRVQGMVSAGDLQTCVDLFEGRMHGISGMWCPTPTKMRMLTSMVWPQDGEFPLHLLTATLTMI